MARLVQLIDPAATDATPSLMTAMLSPGSPQPHSSDDEPGSPIDLGHRNAGVLIATSGRKSVSDVRKMFGGDGT